MTHPSVSVAQSGPQALAPYVEESVALAKRWYAATEEGQTPAERATTTQLASLVRDETGLDLAVTFVDRVARPEDPYVAARDLSRISPKDAAGFLGKVDLGLLAMGTVAAPLAPPLVVPVARWRLRQIIGHLVVDARDPQLGEHLAAQRAQGFRQNINLLGEAVLGENEAAGRTRRTTDLLRREDIDYVSIKISSLVSQISTWDTEGTVERCIERLRPLYRVANSKIPASFVNLDMEEYRDLDLTIELFTRLLDEDEFLDLEAGIVLQAYLPDALPAMERLIAWSRQRRARGGAPIKIRLVKGANLAMEQVEALIHGWKQAPYTTKADVDANYLRCIERALRPDVVDAVRLGVASHNLFDVALAHLLATDRGVGHALDVEMLQGMAPAQSRAVKADVGTVLLYTPVVAPEDFDVAVSYLIRRLEENATEENFLHALFSVPGHNGGERPMDDQERRFRESVELALDVHTGARRTPERPEITDGFENTPDSDPSLPATRSWARAVLDDTPPPLTSRVLGSTDDVAETISRAVSAQTAWGARSAGDRAAVLREAARRLESRRGRLVTVMAAEGGKTVAEADPEVSEAIDFARYYADRALDLEAGAAVDGASFTPGKVVLVTPPWNFPVAIPLGGVLAGLAAGSAVVIKPAHPTVGCVEVGVEALYEAGVPRDALQVVRAADRAVGRTLISHPDVETVILTGSSETGQMFTSWRTELPAGPRVYGETSGKNALVVTPAADLDLAVADLVRSAFGHAGQKCSAASLAILVGSVATSERFRRQLIDAVSSLRVGYPQDLSTTMGPVIEPPEGKLLRALTTLEPGESWLVEPRRLDDSGRLWSPGLKEGVRPGSFFHLTEVFGPVLGLMTARDLDEAIELQNATSFGLTGGLHSLDEKEIDRWTERVDVGNAYVNRHITGAIVRRQSFGGWKQSVMGPGAKAGGPNYVAQLGTWHPTGTPQRLADPSLAVRTRTHSLLPLLTERADRTWLRAAIGSDAYAVETEFGREVDDSALVVETNVFRYRPYPLVWVRTTPGCKVVELLRVVLGGIAIGTRVRISFDPQTSSALKALDGKDVETSAALRVLNEYVDRAETDAQFRARVADGRVEGRVRLIGEAPDLVRDLSGEQVTLFTGPVLATGRRELLVMLREQAISRTMHRFGHVPGTKAGGNPVG
ncbi:L-proline dehydrogenase [Austwickia chelonae]|uniref:L-glutamate gamma-semialdehyde dehydrogenase n=1 Tax=Austwickia chelonae NBRC 105200 TaxID=1184607 RepID=K6VPK8_9MICO|nr:proline dehydrogenase family protein [Austwickia chelonae]GAB78669.1 proline dehydrogenase/delta-1-pyrroline-5-carboxylate dehydrogenase [Austwickia chelonae NBRC 105200]SEW34565.1 L-proline dehydrogenase [Austwickia chelonae]